MPGIVDRSVFEDELVEYGDLHESSISHLAVPECLTPCSGRLPILRARLRVDNQRDQEVSTRLGTLVVP